MCMMQICQNDTFSSHWLTKNTFKTYMIEFSFQTTLKSHCTKNTRHLNGNCHELNIARLLNELK